MNKERTVWVLIPLLFLHLILLSFQIESSSGAMLFKTWIMAIQSPILNACNTVTGGIGNVWKNYVWLTGARKENEQLRRTVDQLRIQNHDYEQTRQENVRLRNLIALNERLSLRKIGARVTARAPDFLSNVLYIDRGVRDGVRIDAPVFSKDGIIGRVILVSDRQSQVQLLTNPDAAIGAMLEHSRTPGVLSGTGDSFLVMNYISNTQPVEVDEIVISSGLDGIFPQGIVIGKVVASEKGNGVFREIKVQPVMDMIHIDEVAVLLELPEKPVTKSK